MKNVEKYVEQIAEMMAESPSCIVAPKRPNEWPICTGCTFEGFCTNEKKLKEWLLQEAES